MTFSKVVPLNKQTESGQMPSEALEFGRRTFSSNAGVLLNTWIRHLHSLSTWFKSQTRKSIAHARTHTHTHHKCETPRQERIVSDKGEKMMEVCGPACYWCIPALYSGINDAFSSPYNLELLIYTAVKSKSSEGQQICFINTSFWCVFKTTFTFKSTKMKDNLSNPN